MSGSFTTYFNRNNNNLNFYKCAKLRDYQNDLLERKYLLKEGLHSTLTKRIKQIAKIIKKLEKEIEQLKILYANPDELVKKYLLTLPVNRKKIDLSDMFEKHSLTTIPDLSRFTELRHLDISMNCKLSSGFDRLPTTLKKLNCFKTDALEDASWILRLTSLESITLSRNERICELPDLSALKNLTDVDISQMNLIRLPNLPLNKIKFLRIPIQGLPMYYSKFHYVNSKLNDMQIFECITKTHSTQIIRRINLINRFDHIREELLATGARIVLSPSRLARLLDQSELDLDSDWSDIYECQTRRVHSTVYYS